jgi:3'-5' exoribonuclease
LGFDHWSEIPHHDCVSDFVPLTISELRQQLRDTPMEASFFCQLEKVAVKQTQSGKPYLEWHVRDAGDHLSVKIWDNHPRFPLARDLVRGRFVCLWGTWQSGAYGIEPKDLGFRELESQEIEILLGGGDSLREVQENDWNDLVGFVESIKDPRLRGICGMVIEDEKLASRLRRAAAARDFHHARRGGLVEHVAQMMRSANAIGQAYPRLNRDLLITGVLFHDIGKLWESCAEERGFETPFTPVGEMLGHITIGIELANQLWRKLLEKPEAVFWKDMKPEADAVRLHLLHLIASHHGEHEWGSPVLPKTPEAIALHYIDNLDAKLEMIRRGLETSAEVGPGILESVRPLRQKILRPLSVFEP